VGFSVGMRFWSPLWGGRRLCIGVLLTLWESYYLQTSTCLGVPFKEGHPPTPNRSTPFQPAPRLPRGLSHSLSFCIICLFSGNRGWLVGSRSGCFRFFYPAWQPFMLSCQFDARSGWGNSAGVQVALTQLVSKGMLKRVA